MINAYQVNVFKIVEHPRDILLIHAGSAEEAKRLALKKMGAGWDVMDVERLDTGVTPTILAKKSKPPLPKPEPLPRDKKPNRQKDSLYCANKFCLYYTEPIPSDMKKVTKGAKLYCSRECYQEEKTNG